MPPDLVLSSTLIGSNYPCLELIFMVPKVFEPLKFDCIWSVNKKSYQFCLDTFHLLSYLLVLFSNFREADSGTGTIKPFVIGHPKMEKLQDIVLNHFNNFAQQGASG